MPITQDRMIALISAARDYKQALTRVTTAISNASTRVSLGQSSLQEAFGEICNYEQIVLLLQDPLNSPSVIEIEAAYFKRNARRNIAAAKWQAEDRALKAQGITPARKSYKPDKQVPTYRPAAPDHSSPEHGIIREIAPGSRPDLDALIAEELARQETVPLLIETEEGQKED